MMRRLATVAALCAGLLVLGLTPAQAAFSARDAVVLSAATLTVDAPGSVDAAGSWCNNGVLYADVDWQLAVAPRVASYTVTAHYTSGATRVIATVSPSTTSMQGIVPNQGASTARAVTVTTTTGYGWSATSTQVPVPPC